MWQSESPEYDWKLYPAKKNVISSQNISPERGGEVERSAISTQTDHETPSHTLAEGLISVSLLEQPSGSCTCCDLCLFLFACLTVKTLSVNHGEKSVLGHELFLVFRAFTSFPSHLFLLLHLQFTVLLKLLYYSCGKYSLLTGWQVCV